MICLLLSRKQISQCGKKLVAWMTRNKVSSLRLFVQKQTMDEGQASAHCCYLSRLSGGQVSRGKHVVREPAGHHAGQHACTGLNWLVSTCRVSTECIDPNSEFLGRQTQS